MCLFQRAVLDLFFNFICLVLPFLLLSASAFVFLTSYIFLGILLLFFRWVNMMLSMHPDSTLDWSPDLWEKNCLWNPIWPPWRVGFGRSVLNRKLINNLREQWAPVTRDSGHLFTQSRRDIAEQGQFWELSFCNTLPSKLTLAILFLLSLFWSFASNLKIVYCWTLLPKGSKQPKILY